MPRSGLGEVHVVVETLLRLLGQSSFVVEVRIRHQSSLREISIDANVSTGDSPGEMAAGSLTSAESCLRREMESDVSDTR